MAQRSQSRRSKNPEFVAHLKWLQENARWRSRKSTTLEEKKFLDAMRKFKKASPAGGTTDSKLDPQLNEAIEVAVDYLGRVSWYPLYAEGMRLFRQKEYAESAVKFSEAIALAPNSKVARAGRALAYAGQGDWDRAIKEAKEAGQTGIPCRVTKTTVLRSGTKTIAKAATGTLVWVTTTNEDWLWARLKTDSKKKGWIEKQYLSPVAD